MERQEDGLTLGLRCQLLFSSGAEALSPQGNCGDAVVAHARLLVSWLIGAMGLCVSWAGLYHGRDFYPTTDIKEIDSSNGENKSDRCGCTRAQEINNNYSKWGSTI